MEKRESRDAALETLRKAEILLLAGKLTSGEVDGSRQAAKEAADEYERARKIVALGGALLRIPDPSAAAAERLNGQQRGGVRAEGDDRKEPPLRSVPPPDKPPADSLDGVRTALGLQNRAPPEQPTESLLPSGSGSITLKDAAIGVVFVLQLGWFVLSLTDPMGTPNPLLRAALTAGGDAVDRREADKVAASTEYKAMLQAAVDAGEAPPTCATRRLDDPLGGCANAQLNDALLAAPLP